MIFYSCIATFNKLQKFNLSTATLLHLNSALRHSTLHSSNSTAALRLINCGKNRLAESDTCQDLRENLIITNNNPSKYVCLVKKVLKCTVFYRHVIFGRLQDANKDLKATKLSINNSKK